MKTPIAAAAVLLLAAGPAMAVQVTESTRLAAPVDTVWQQIQPFCGISDWHPAVEKCELKQQGKQQVRVLSIKGGGVIEERLLSSSNGSHRVKYTILTSPLPVKDYTATMTLKPKNKGTKVVWRANFTAKGASDEEARKVISGIFTAGFDGLQRKFGK